MHNWKHSDAVRAASRRCSPTGAVGRPTHLRLETIRAGRAASVGSEWRGDAALAGGGILVDHGWHAFYLLLEPRQRAAAADPRHLERRRYTSADVEDTATCEIEFPSLRGEIFLTWAGDTRAARAGRCAARTAAVTLADDRGELVRRRSAPRADLRALALGRLAPPGLVRRGDRRASPRRSSDPARRGRNLAEAERCLLLTALAYESGAQGGARARRAGDRRLEGTA